MVGGGFGGFDAPKTLTPVFMSQADLNRDGLISREEFASLARRWFKAWDTNGAGKLDEGQIRAGLDKIRSPVGGGMMLQGPEGKRNGIGLRDGHRVRVRACGYGIRRPAVQRCGRSL